MLMKWLIIMLVISIIKQINITSELNEMNITMIIVLFTGDGNLISKDRNGIKAVVVESPHQKPTICTCENKDADQLCSNCTDDQRLCFPLRDSTIPLLKSKI